MLIRPHRVHIGREGRHPPICFPHICGRENFSTGEIGKTAGMTAASAAAATVSAPGVFPTHGPFRAAALHKRFTRRMGVEMVRIRERAPGGPLRRKGRETPRRGRGPLIADGVRLT